MTRSLVLFDCDGTLVDSQHDIVAAMEQAFQSHGLTPPARGETLASVGLSVPEAIHALAPALGAAMRDRIGTTFRGGFSAQGAHSGREDPLYPGALEAITTLAAHETAVLGIATGKSRRGVARLFDKYNWHGAFATIQTADTNPSKPDPAMILTAMAETGVEPARTIMIGDTSFDMVMARAAGVRAIGVAWGYHPVGALEAAGAGTIVHDFAGLRAALDRLL